MNTQENDPDTLQLLDETDKKWVKLWRKVALKETTSNNLVPIILQQENMETPQPKAKSNH
jgi:hypothetical protein